VLILDVVAGSDDDVINFVATADADITLISCCSPFLLFSNIRHCPLLHSYINQ